MTTPPRKTYDTPPLPGEVWLEGELEDVILDTHAKATDGRIRARFGDLYEDGQGTPHRLKLYVGWMLGFTHENPDTEHAVNEINVKQLNELFLALGVKDEPDYKALPDFVGQRVRVRVGRWVKKGMYWVPQGLKFEAVDAVADAPLPF